MNIPSWQETFMTIAETVSKRSKCLRMKTGALLVKDKRIISIGYNGTVPNDVNCVEYWKSYKEEKYSGMDWGEFVENKLPEMHHDWSVVNEIHGEQNAILFAGKQGISTNNTELYTLYSPCINCAKVIITAGISEVYYNKLYKRDTRGIDFLEKRGVKCKYVSI